ncbi:DNA mismatch endonuclease Vsr [Candidatus Gugararchaeum adminiculabundum]|nr:DNA mismatch endonuclease Vsr [Candidatus Gugararchaeum adminiculabundum]
MLLTETAASLLNNLWDKKRMADIFSKRKRSYIMSRVRGKNTSPEVALRKILRGCGHRYRLHYGKQMIDIAFPKERVALFMDGCFWHKCPKHFRMPRSNTAFWKRKINGNAQRDKRETALLKKKGWTVVRIWEHELRNEKIRVLGRIRKFLGDMDGVRKEQGSHIRG